MSKLFTKFSRNYRFFNFNLRTYQSEPYSTKIRFSEDDVEEIRIPMPWGHIAGKWWGKKNENPLIGIHGWQENAGAYDRLIPLLNVPNFLAIDLPGHGLSSHLPNGKLYTYPEYIFTLRRIVKYFNWKKYSLFGHSFGSSLGFIYSSLYPDEIEYFISFECARSLLLAFAVNHSHHLAQGIDKLLENEKKLKDEFAPSYTLSEIVQSCIVGSLGSLNSSESALALLKRGAEKYKKSDVQTGRIKKKSDLRVFLDHELSQNEELKKLHNYEEIINDLEKTKFGDVKDTEYVYKFTKDPRIKLNIFGVLNDELILEFSKHITCPVLSIEAEDGFLKLESKKIYVKSNEIIKTKSRKFKFSLMHTFHWGLVIRQLRCDYKSSHEKSALVCINGENASLILMLCKTSEFFFVAGKYWGSRNARAFLLLHGWQDNAGSFDTLIPLLPNENSYLAIDLPGHGFSSYYPQGAFYTLPDMICCLRRIQKYFDWPKISLIGHSLGSMLCYMLSSVYNDDVDIYIGLDNVKAPTVEMEEYRSEARDRIEKFLLYDSFKPESAKSYQEEVFISKLKEGLKTNNENVCKIMMKRGAIEKDGLFSPIRDPRIKSSNPFSFTQSDHLKIAERIKCNVLVIKSTETSYFESEKYFYEVLDVIKKNAKHFEFVKIPGTHHFHLETPEVVAPIIHKFLNDVK